MLNAMNPLSVNALKSVSVLDFGASGDGKADDTQAIQAALDSGAGLVAVPFGRYLVSSTLKIGSNTRLKAHRNAEFRLKDGSAVNPEDFLLTNKNWENGDENISVEGGVWNYNNVGNPRGHSLLDQTGPSGRMLNFFNVKNLTLADLTVQDPECYYICLCKVKNFLIEDIRFETMHLSGNQDGVHLAGFCKNGIIRRLRASPKSPNDDFVALNADDIFTRQEASNLVGGPIENIVIDGLDAKECHSFVRINSLTSHVNNISINDLRGACRAFVLNMDATRYCRTPLFKDEDYPDGIGNAENITISNVHTCSVGPCKGLFCLETLVKNFTARNFSYDFANAASPNCPAVFIGKISDEKVYVSGLDESRAKELQTLSACKLLKIETISDPFRKNRKQVYAEVCSGEKLVVPAGGFDLLKIN